MNNKELQERLRAAEKEIAEVRELMQKQSEQPKAPKWEDLEEVEGWYVSVVSNVMGSDTYITINSHKNITPTKEEAEAKLAEAQLEQLRDSKFYRNGWKPDWSDMDILKYCVYQCSDIGLRVESWSTIPCKFSFQDKETAERFLNEQRELLEIWLKGQMQ